MKTPSTKKKAKKLSRIEQALILLAEYMQDPVHDQYMVKAQVLDILGLQEVLPANKPKKK